MSQQKENQLPSERRLSCISQSRLHVFVTRPSHLKSRKVNLNVQVPCRAWRHRPLCWSIS